MGAYDSAIERLQQLGLGNQWNNTTIVAEALKRDIEVTRRSTTRYLNFRHSEKTYNWHRGRTSYNSLIAKRIADDKILTSRYLTSRGFAVAENALFKPGQAQRAWAWGEPLGPLVVKPFNGIKGRGVHVNLTNEDHFIEAFRKVSDQYGDVLVEQLCTGDERRFLVVNNKLVAALNRRPPSVVGDGKCTIQDLIDKKNVDRTPPLYPIKVDSRALDTLSSQGQSLTTIPATGQRVYLRTVINIHAGGDPVDITDTVTDKQRQVAEAAAQSVPGLRMVGFDVFLQPEASDASMIFIEMNSNPDITMHHHPVEGSIRDAAGAILDGMFPATARGSNRG